MRRMHRSTLITIDFRKWLVAAIFLWPAIDAINFYVISPMITHDPVPTLTSFITWEIVGFGLGFIALLISRAKARR